MTGRYARINTQDQDHDQDDHDEFETPTQQASNPLIRQSERTHSPPPSFHSRASSLERRRQGVDPTLADAFDNDDDDSDDDEPDDRQRLVRGNSFPVDAGNSAPSSQTRAAAPSLPPRQPTQWPTPAAASNATHVPGMTYGAGIQSDGVFSNMMARPERGEKVVEEQPPTYEQAAADAAPHGMPVGSIFSFIWNGMISMSFQFVGFLLTYLLHSTHAAKNGSRAGLGIILIQYGFYMKGAAPGGDGMSGAPQDGYAQPPDPNSHDFDPNAVSTGENGSGNSLSDLASSEWIAYILMIVGWFILIRAVSDYIRARRHEQLVLQSPDRGLPIPIIATGEPSERVV
ncbi:hypothetical protein PG997_007087 [Apiospora hydei]|uniref:Metal homeostatis protein bsd2 n=1 Tax=Apiospora hydei TaxID=1337664 RepID=A0ABR1WQL4_9PEZI